MSKKNASYATRFFASPLPVFPAKRGIWRRLYSNFSFSYCAHREADGVCQKQNISKKHRISIPKKPSIPICHKFSFSSEQCVSGPRASTQYVVFMSTTLPIHAWEDSGTVLAPLWPKEHNPCRIWGRTTGDLYGPWRFTRGRGQVISHFKKMKIVIFLKMLKSGENVNFTIFTLVRHDFSHASTSILAKKCLFESSAPQTFFLAFFPRWISNIELWIAKRC